MTGQEFQDRLSERASLAGLALSADLSAKLEAYYRLLVVWNRKINLTGLDLTDTTPASLDRLLVEPILAASHVRAGSQTMIDVGSGGGSPAIPFALSAGLRLLMVESKARKSVFLREALRTVGMLDSDVATARFEELYTSPRLHQAHDILTIRAVRIEPAVLVMLGEFIRPGGQLFLFRSTAQLIFTGNTDCFLTSAARFPLIDSLNSELIVLTKGASGGSPRTDVPRGTFRL